MKSKNKKNQKKNQKKKKKRPLLFVAFPPSISNFPSFLLLASLFPIRQQKFPDQVSGGTLPPCPRLLRHWYNPSPPLRLAIALLNSLNAPETIMIQKKKKKVTYKKKKRKQQQQQKQNGQLDSETVGTGSD